MPHPHIQASMFQLSLSNPIRKKKMFPRPPFHKDISIFLGHLLLHSRSRDSTVGIATDYGLNGRGVGVRVPVRSRIFSSSRRPDQLLCPANLLTNGYRERFPRGVKGPGREADHSPPTTAEVKKIWVRTCIPPYVLMA
jgi:hypothetical protein